MEGQAGDEKLLEAARAGDGGALDALLARHQRQVYRFGLKMCRDEEDAKDVLQETLLAVARGLKDFRGASSVSTWLYTIARSFCIKKRRRSKFAPEQEEPLDAEADGEPMQIADSARAPDESLAGRQIEAALEAAIGSLAPMYREVLVLRDVEGLSAQEVAEVLGLTVEAVKSRLHRARLAVRERVAPLLGLPAPGAGPSLEPCPDIVRIFSQHLEGEISADACARMEAHLATCRRCQGSCDSLRQTLRLCQKAPLPEVPAQVQARLRRALAAFLAEHR
jgi:RNA polymerase sigma-70 factor (ECF subfamily)